VAVIFSGALVSNEIYLFTDGVGLYLKTVLPSFSGNVPAALTKIYPSAKITRLGDWNTVDADPRWCCTYLLDPSDPLFVEIGEAFIRKQIKVQSNIRVNALTSMQVTLFGEDDQMDEDGRIVCGDLGDTFNENSPPTSDPEYISTLGAAVYQGISKGDKDAVWLMQGWLFYSDSSFWKPPQMKPENREALKVLVLVELCPIAKEMTGVCNIGSGTGDLMMLLIPIEEVGMMHGLTQAATMHGMAPVNSVFDFVAMTALRMKLSWLAVALLQSVPSGKMIVLDLFADVKPIWKTSFQFYGTPYIWCMLHNFGGNIEMYGVLDSIGSGPIDARVSANSTMVGVGMCMEGIEHNPIVYELMSEMAFRDEKVKINKWLKSYSHRRYGKAVHQIDAAWEILYHTIYNCTDGIADHNHDYIAVLPDWDPSTNIESGMSNHQQKIYFLPPGNRRYLFQQTPAGMPQAHLWYPPEDVIKALQLFLAGGKNLTGSLTYRYDLVDLTRQVLSKFANQVYIKAVTSFQEKNIDDLHLNSHKFLQLIKDIDLLLASDDNFLLGTWLESAKKLAVNPNTYTAVIN
ncbi:alpha-n-acetylglucosaminidase-like protein, partial [Trifolium pratense]